MTNKTKDEGTPPQPETRTNSGYATPETDKGPHRVQASAGRDKDGGKPLSIKEEPQDDLVDGSLFAGAAQLLANQDTDDDVLS